MLNYVINGTFQLHAPCMLVMQSVLCNWVQETIYSEAWQAVAGHYTAICTCTLYTVMLTTVYQPNTGHIRLHTFCTIHGDTDCLYMEQLTCSPLSCGVRPVAGCVGGLLRGRAWPLHGEAVSPCLYTLVLRSTQSQQFNAATNTVTGTRPQGGGC